MKLSYFKEQVSNFGDDLNPLMWNAVLPEGFLDEDESELFLGIGSILWDDWPKKATKHVMGSGFGGYRAGPPDMRDGTWNPVFVRGPRTAKILGLAPEKAICDAAIFIPAMKLPERRETGRVVFMPHFQSLRRGLWKEACDLAGITMVDPTGDVMQILEEIRGAKLVITEAMHGAIVADIVRTPWIATIPLAPEHHMKWWDWADALEIPLKPNPLLPTTALEGYISMTGSNKKHGPRAYKLNNSPLLAPVNKLLTYRAANRLRKLTTVEPQLSADANLARAHERAMEALNGFVRTRVAAGV